MSPFRTMLDPLFTTLGTAAMYHPEAGERVAVTVIEVEADDGEAQIGFSGAVVPSKRIDIRASELVAAPTPGDRVQVGDVVYAVKTCRKDSERLVWRLRVDEDE